ncbi:collagen-binding protein [Corynebacterium diphtheriae]|uniref:VaFE repeat-containing surface-anchored protein n=1 Tax=Corynebacterium diphtheriae TaxID=1717 RepID=UPI000893682F|nr:VaFE repeat-containing surface-anchored protein [Corynebacterium diphtheriae]OFI56621.1 collagen-binding protein [Corynebacterium diphtheriae]
MKVHLPLGLRLSSGDIFRSSIIFVVIIASLVFASVRAVAVDNGGSSEKKIRISKFAEDDNSKELPDAELAVYKGDYEGAPDSTKVITTWTTGSAKDISFGEGTYTLVEKSAPQGYGIASNIVFKVEKDKVLLKNGENWREIKKFVPEDPKPLKAYTDYNDDRFSWGTTPFGKFYYLDRDDENKSANADEIIYCFNLRRHAPLESYDYGANLEMLGRSHAPTFKAQYDAETLIKYAENPRIKDPKKFGDAIQRVIYAGHPRNHKKFEEGLTPTAFRTITQMAIYNFTDSFGLKELEEVVNEKGSESNDAHGFAGILDPKNEKIKKAYEELVAYAEGYEPVPAGMRTPLYVTSDNEFQNFVGTWTDPESVLPVIEMIDRKAPLKPKEHEVLIAKVDLGGKDVDGAELRILKGDAESSKEPEIATDLQNNTPAQWKTVKGEAHTVKLAAGKYKLEETFAPAPLKVITTFEFEVDVRGDVTLGEVKTAGKNGDGEAVPEARVQGDDKNVISVVDGIDESKVAQNVKISKVDLGGVEVDGAKLQVLKVGSDSVVQDVMTRKPAEWTTSKNEKVHEVSLLPGSYRLKESFAPQDLKPITTFEFSVDAQGVVTVKDVAVAGHDADGHEVKEAVVNDQGVVVVTDGAQKQEKPTVTLNTNAYDADAPRWDNTLDSTGGTIADAISYEGLVPGKQYRVKGELMDKTTKKPLGVEMIDTFEPKAANGEHIMKFNVDASFAGKSIVVFETVYEDNGEEIKEDTPYVVRHADFDSASQTIVVDSAYTPKSISTQAYNKDDVNKGKTIPAEGGTVVDVVTYKGLKAGNTYTISGELMDKETQKGTGITSQKTFTAEGTDGEVELEFIVGPGFAGKDLVVFETLRDDGGFEVATHEDIGSAPQTVSVASLKESSGWEIWAAGAVIGAGIIGLLSGNGSSAPDTGSSNVHPSPKPSTQPSVAPTSVLPNADKSQEKAGKGSKMLAKTGASILGLLIAAILFTLAGFGLVSWRRKN